MKHQMLRVTHARTIGCLWLAFLDLRGFTGYRWVVFDLRDTDYTRFYIRLGWFAVSWLHRDQPSDSQWRTP